MEITNSSCTRAWVEALEAIRASGDRFTDEHGNLCVEVLNLTITIEDSGSVREPLRAMQTRKTWHYPSADELERMITDPKKGSFSYTYGNRIRAYRGVIDQISDFIVPLLRSRSWSRRAVITLWDPESDAGPTKQVVPGHISLDFKLRAGKLNVTSTVRSADMFFGFPANVFQVSIIQHQVCRALNVKPGTITTFCTSAHVFEYQFEDMDKLLGELENESQDGPRR